MESLIQKAFEQAFGPSYNEYVKKEVEKNPFKEFGLEEYGTRIAVIGVGGAGNNMVNTLSNMGIDSAETIAINTDAIQLSMCSADKKLLIGKETTKGRGAGGFPEIGKHAAIENESAIKHLIKGIDMVYILTGLGGGTGTGASPVIAKYAKEMGAIVITCATMPFRAEGARINKASDGLLHLRQNCDTVIVIENDKLLNIAGNQPLTKAFKVADELIANMIKGVTEAISKPSLVNLDYADVKAIMHSGGVATVGYGESKSNNRAEEAIIKAMNHPLLEVDYNGGKGALIHITAGNDLKLEEANYITEYVQKQLAADAQVIWGVRIDPEFDGKIRVITIITGVNSPYILGPIANVESIDVRKELGIRVYS